MKAKTPPMPSPKMDPNKSLTSSGKESHKRAVHNAHIKATQASLGQYVAKQ